MAEIPCTYDNDKSIIDTKMVAYVHYKKIVEIRPNRLGIAYVPLLVERCCSVLQHCDVYPFP